jgi:hypothetical protein
MTRFKLFIIYFFVTSFYSYGSDNALRPVWEKKNEWTLEIEKKYQAWVRTEFQNDTFTNPENYTCGIITDCADMVYVARAIFAFENDLVFSVLDPRDKSRKKFITSENAFEVIGEEKMDQKIQEQAHALDISNCPIEKMLSTIQKKKNVTLEEIKNFRKFIYYLITEFLSTRTLANNDTLPVDPTALMSGDLYVSETSPGTFHVFLLKNINEYGRAFYVYRSTSKILDGISEINTKELRENSMKLFNPTSTAWGYKRFLWPGEYAINFPSQEIGKIEEKNLKLQSEIAESEQRGFSFNQYKHIASKNFHENVIAQSLNFAVKSEPFSEAVSMMFKDVCSHLASRVNVVKNTLELFKKNNNQCFSKLDFDLYSTPTRDSRIMNRISELLESWDELYEKNQEDKSKNFFEHSSLIKFLKSNVYGQFEMLEYEERKAASKTEEIYSAKFSCPLYSFQLNAQGSEQKESFAITNEIGDLVNQENISKYRFNVSVFIKHYTGPINDETDKRFLSSNPNDPLAARWGLDYYWEEIIQDRNRCESY